MTYTAPVLSHCPGVHRSFKVLFTCPGTSFGFSDARGAWSVERGAMERGAWRGRDCGGTGKEALRRPTASVCEKKVCTVVTPGVLAGVRETGGTVG